MQNRAQPGSWLGVKQMVTLFLNDDKYVELTSWRNFCDHISNMTDDLEDRNALGDKGRFSKWWSLRDQELQKWQAQLVSRPRNPPINLRDQSYLLFQDHEALTAFQLAWS